MQYSSPLQTYDDISQPDSLSSTEATSFNDALRTILGYYRIGPLFRSVSSEYTQKDIDRLRAQSRGERSSWVKDFKKASSDDERLRIIGIVTTPFHEAIHYLQYISTSYGLFATIRWFNLVYACLKYAANKAGNFEASFFDYIMSKPKDRGNYILEEQEFITILYGTRLIKGEPPKELVVGAKRFWISHIAGQGGILWPQVMVRIDNHLYPFGAYVLMESWAYSLSRAVVLGLLGQDALAFYTKRLKHPLFPYRILDRILCEDFGETDPYRLFTLQALIGLYSLNFGVFNPDQGFQVINGTPGYRAVSLLNELVSYVDTHRCIRFSHAFLSTYSLDSRSEWGGFMHNAVQTLDAVSSWWQRAWDRDLRIHTSPGFRTTGILLRASHYALGNIVSDSASLTNINRWLHDYGNNIWPRPPLNAFRSPGSDINEKILFLPDEVNKEEMPFLLMWYVLEGFAKQMMCTYSIRCPYIVEHLHCESGDQDETCNNQIRSCDEEWLNRKQQCLLAIAMRGIKQYIDPLTESPNRASEKNAG